MRSEANQEKEVESLGNFFAFLTGWSCRHPWLVLSFTVLSCSLCIAWTMFRLEFKTQRTDLLDPNKDFLKHWVKYIEEFGDDNDMVILIKDPSGNQKDITAAVEELAGKIKDQPQLFDRLFYKFDLRSLRDRGLLFLPLEQIQKIQSKLKDPEMRDLLNFGPLLNVSWKNVSYYRLLNKGKNDLAELSPDGKGDSHFFKQLDQLLQITNEYLVDPDRYKNPWISIFPQSAEQKDELAEPRYFFNDKNNLAFLLVHPKMEASSSFTFARASIEELGKIVAEIRLRYPDLTFGLTGLPVLDNDEMVSSQQGSEKTSLIALGLVALLYVVVYRRRVRYSLLVVAPLLVGIFWSMGWVTGSVGHLNILSSAFVVMLIGMANYGVLWLTRYKQEREHGADLEEATRQTALHVGPSILVAALTTALAFFVALFANLRGVVELGIIAGGGILLCALSCYLVLPALLAIMDKNGPKEVPSSELVLPLTSARPWLPFLTTRVPYGVITCTLILTLAMGFFVFRIKYDHNLLNLQAHGLESVQWIADCPTLEALSVTATPEEARTLKARFEKLPKVAAVIEAASLVPPDQERKLPILEDIQNRLQPLPAKGKIIPHAPPSEEVPKLGAEILGALSTLNVQHYPWATSLKANLEKFLAKIDAVGFEKVRPQLQEFEEKMTLDLALDLHRLREVATPKPIKISDLPTAVRERFIGKNEKWLVKIIGKDSMWNIKDLEHFVEQVHTVNPDAFGRPFNTLEGLRALQKGFIMTAIYALIAIFIVLWADFGNLGHTFLALFPLIAAIILTLGIMALAGLPLNPANMLAFSLILGVGADNGVHVLHDYRNRTRGQRYSLNWATGRGIMVSALTTILGFGTMMIAQHRGMASLGRVLALGVACCMLTALVFLPALLRVLSIREIQRSELAKKKREVA